MTVYFVSRHDGALRWARILQKHGVMPMDVDAYVNHIDTAQLHKGDVVIGTLPLREAQRLGAQGVRFINLDLQVPVEWRGQELTATQMAACGATLTEYRVTVKESFEIDAMRKRRARGVTAPKPAVTVMLVSQELMPQFLGYLHMPTPEVVLLVTESMEKRAQHLEALLQKAPEPPKKVISLTLDEGGGLPALRDQADSLMDELLAQGRERIIVNVTGGTKLMSLAFGDASRAVLREHEGLRIQYVDTAQGRLEFLDGAAPLPMRALLGVADAVLASGKADAGCANASPVFRNHMQRQALHHYLLQKSMLIGMLNGLCRQADSADVKAGTLRQPANSELGKRLQDKLGSLLLEQGVLQCAPRKADGQIELQLARPSEWGYLQGGWLEAEVGRRIAATKPDDWACGVAVGHESGKNNEIDAIVTAGNRTLLIEIKTAYLRREQVQDDGASSTKAQDTLYKLDSIGHELARNFNVNWLVSARTLSNADLERAKDKRIRVFSPANDSQSAIACLSEFDAELKKWIDESRSKTPGGKGLNARPLQISHEWKRRQTQDEKKQAPKPGASNTRSNAGMALKAADLEKLKALKVEIASPKAPQPAASDA